MTNTPPPRSTSTGSLAMGAIAALDLVPTAFMVMPVRGLTPVWAALSGLVAGAVVWRLLAVRRRGEWTGALAGLVTAAAGYWLFWYIVLLEIWAGNSADFIAGPLVIVDPPRNPVESLFHASYWSLRSLVNLGWRCVPILVIAGAILGRVKRRELAAAEMPPKVPAEAPEMTQPAPETPGAVPRGSLVMGLVGVAGVVPAAVWPIFRQGAADPWGLFWLWAALSGFAGGSVCWRLLAARRPSLSQGFLAGLAGIYCGLCLYWLLILLAIRFGNLGSGYYPGLDVEALPLPAAVKYVVAPMVLAYGNLYLGWFSSLAMPGAGAWLGRRLSRRPVGDTTIPAQ